MGESSQTSFFVCFRCSILTNTQVCCGTILTILNKLYDAVLDSQNLLYQIITWIQACTVKVSINDN